MNFKRVRFVLRPLSLLAMATSVFVDRDASADVTLPAIFSDHAVLQAGKPVNVWGWAMAGEAVRVSVAGTSAETVTAADGSWRVQLKPLGVGGPHTLEVSGNNALHADDVLVGEVWLCAGQSNMEMPLRTANREVDDADAVIAEADHPTLRMFVQDEAYALRSTAVPPSEPLADRAGRWVVCTPRTAPKFTAVGYFFARQVQAKVDAPVGLINAAVGGTTIEAWTSRDAMDAVPELRGLLDDWARKLASYDPVAAKRKADELRAEWTVRRTAAEKGGEPVPKAPFASTYRNLAVNTPAGLFNGVLAPIVPYTLRGALWYQGERNATGEFSPLYGRQLQTLIADWRTRFGDDFYFAIMQLPRYQKAQVAPSEDDGWGVWVREGQRQAVASVPNTSMAVTIDLGGATPEWLHPTNKQEFARRLAMQALSDVYDQKSSPCSGPLFHDATRVENRMVVHFKFADGLTTRGGSASPKGFAIAGEDRKFVWAEARIEGDAVVVWSDAVPEPVAVRYAWAGNPTVDLQNSVGLPAAPFRSDSWPPAGDATTGATTE